MGYYAEQAMEQAFEDYLMAVEEDFFEEAALPEAPRGVWKQGTGKEVRVRAMTDSHLENAIRWIRRNIPDYRWEPKYQMLLRERRRRRKENGRATQ